MLKRIIQACFLIVGGTLGMILIPELLVVLHADDIALLNNPYVSVLLGAIIFYLITFWAVDHVIYFMKWLEEQLVKIPITDIIFGSVGLLVGLLAAFLVGYAFSAIGVPILNTVVPI
ncbi:PIN domain nuclease, partial [Bacillus sp. mrc49]